MSQFPDSPRGYAETPHNASAMTPEQLAAAAGEDTPYEIAEDTVCLTCEYNLRGLSSDGRCPECGTAIGRSLKGNFLRYADPVYVRRLATGAKLLLWGIAASIIGGVLNGIIGAAMDDGGVLSSVVGLAGGVLGIAGSWLVTTPDPNRIDVGWQISARWFVRVSVVLAVGSHLVSLIGGLVNASGGVSTTSAPATSAGLAIVLMVLGLAFTVIWLISYFAQFVYFRGLAMRIPDLKLARNTRNVMWGMVICGSLTVASFVLSVALGAGGAAGGAVGVGIAGSCAGAIGLVVCALAWVRQLIAYRRRFDEAATLAEAGWAAGAATGQGQRR